MNGLNSLNGLNGLNSLNSLNGLNGKNLCIFEFLVGRVQPFEEVHRHDPTQPHNLHQFSAHNFCVLHLLLRRYTVSLCQKNSGI